MNRIVHSSYSTGWLYNLLDFQEQTTSHAIESTSLKGPGNTSTTKQGKLESFLAVHSAPLVKFKNVRGELLN